MNNSITQIKALHLFDLHGSKHGYSHTQTIIVHKDGFQFLVKGVSDDIANRRVKTLMERTKKKRQEMEAQGQTLKFEDYLEISQIGLHSRFVGSVNTYTSEIGLNAIINKERSLLDDGAIKFKYPKSGDNDSKKQLSDLIFPPMTREIESDLLQVFEDYPTLLEEFSNGVPDINSPGMVEFLFAKLGSVDPNGPNGWFLKLFDENGNLKEI